jgi:hypothetical protein
MASAAPTRSDHQPVTVYLHLRLTENQKKEARLDLKPQLEGLLKSKKPLQPTDFLWFDDTDTGNRAICS